MPSFKRTDKSVKMIANFAAEIAKNSPDKDTNEYDWYSLGRVLEEIRTNFLAISDISFALRGNKHNKIAAIIKQINTDIREEWFKGFIYKVKKPVIPSCVDFLPHSKREFDIHMHFDGGVREYTFIFNEDEVLTKFVLDGPEGKKTVPIKSFDEFKKYQYDEHTIRQIVHYMRIYNDILFSALLEMQDYVSMYNSMKIEK